MQAEQSIEQQSNATLLAQLPHRCSPIKITVAEIG
jgi:hypothetical protein